MVPLLCARDSAIQRQRKEMLKVRKLKTYWKNQCTAWESHAKDTEEELRSLTSQVVIREGRNVIVQGAYHLALRRNAGLVSSTAVVALLGGMEYQGGLRSRHVVTKYENNTAIAYQQRSKNENDQASRDVRSASEACDGEDLTIPTPTSVVQRQMAIDAGSVDDAPALVLVPAKRVRFAEATTVAVDATNHDAVGREKVHMADVATITTDIAAVDQQLIALSRSQCLADVQSVKLGAAEELHGIVLKGFESVGRQAGETEPLK